MKNFLFATAATIALFAAAAFACETKPIPGTNAFQKVDPNCQFDEAIDGQNMLIGGTITVDDDKDPSTPDVERYALKTGVTDPASVITVTE